MRRGSVSDIEELSRRVAEIVGDEGFKPEAYRCPNERRGQGGHIFALAFDADNRFCGCKCGVGIAELIRVPNLYAESLDLIVPIVEAWCDAKDRFMDFHLSRQQRVLKAEVWRAAFGLHRPETGLLSEAYGETGAEAIARAFLAAVERWGA